MSATRTDLESALDDLLRAQPLGPGDAPRILAVVAEVLRDHPLSLGAILPDHIIVKRPLTIEEKLGAANGVRVGRINDRKNAALSVVKRLRSTNPAISEVQLAASLNSMQVQPLHAAPWNSRSIRRLLRFIND